MPVDEDFAHTWPIYWSTFSTPDDTPVTTVLAVAAGSGDTALLPEVHAVGAAGDGSLGRILLGGYTVVNDSGTLELYTAFSHTANIGAGGPTIAVLLSGTEFHLVATGLVATTILWCVYWRQLPVEAP